MSIDHRYLVIGSGSIARRHIANLKLLFEGCEIGCLSASGRTLSLEEAGATVLLASLSEAIKWAPRFGIVASPSTLHVVQAAALLNHEIPVLIEKPLAHNLASFLEYSDTLSRHSSRIEIGYNLRYLSSAQYFKNLIQNQAIGQIYNIQIDVGQYLPNWRPETNYKKNVSAQRKLGGGVLLELSHEFDYLTWIFGKFDCAYCLTSNTKTLDIDVEDNVDIMLSRKNGLVAHLHMDFLQHKATRVCKVIGEQGNLIWDLVTNTISLSNDQNTKLLFNEPNVDRNDMYLAELQRFSLTTTGKYEPSVSLGEALYTLKLIEVLRLSADEGRTVTLEGL